MKDSSTFLSVTGPNAFLAENDDADDTAHSALDLVLPAGGAYRIRVTSYNDGETGAYRLSIADARSPAAPAPAAPNLVAAASCRSTGAAAGRPSPAAQRLREEADALSWSVDILAIGAADPNLPFSEISARLAQAPFGGASAVVLPNAHDKASVIASLRRASYWHFSTHGVFDFSNPRLSALTLPGGDRLTLSDLYFAEQPIGAPTLVVLSACETALFDVEKNPDEFIGLPTGFIQAGAAGVVATLWQVTDLSSTLLTTKFYQLHLLERQRASQALRNAQLWLKNATQVDLTAFVDSLQLNGSIDEAESERMHGAILETQGAQPFSHPYHRGAWVYFGASTSLAKVPGQAGSGEGDAR